MYINITKNLITKCDLIKIYTFIRIKIKRNKLSKIILKILNFRLLNYKN